MRNLSLNTKFTLFLSAVFLVGMLASGFALWQELGRQAETEVTSKGLLLIDTMSAVRDYTGSHVRPLLADGQTDGFRFVSESVPAFAAVQVFERFRHDSAYANYLYKEASPNPMNPRNQADGFEAGLVAQMGSSPEIQELSGFRTRNGELVYYIARPLSVGSAECLECHSTPEAAPPGLLTAYGSQNGFGWEVGQVIAAQLVYVPSGDVMAMARDAFIRVMFVFIFVLALVLVLVNFLLGRDVIQPIGVLAGLASKIRDDELEKADLESERLLSLTGRTDELGQSARVFQRMAREVQARTESLKQQVQELFIEVDAIKRQKQVAEVVETDFFRDLQAKAQNMRRRHAPPAHSAPEEEGEEARGTPALRDASPRSD